MTPALQAASRAASAAGSGGASRKTSSTRRRAGVKDGAGGVVVSASSPAVEAVQSRRARGGCNASKTLIAMRSTAPGDAIV